MISEMAMEDAEALARKGVVLTPREIVRLNALGVKAERHPDASSFHSLPRCAFLGDLVFTEPTIGHQLWLDNATRVYAEDDDTTMFLLRAYALSTPQESLPEWTDQKAVSKAVKSFAREALSNFTLRQVIDCLNYCTTGSDASDLEFPPDSEPDGGFPDEPYSSAAGVLHEAQALKLGLSTADASRMTQSELQSVIQRRYELDGIEVDKSIKRRAIGDYYATLEEIKRNHENG